MKARAGKNGRGRPWCACVQVRLANRRDKRIRQVADRISVHEYGRCTHYRAGVAGLADDGTILLKTLAACEAEAR